MKTTRSRSGLLACASFHGRNLQAAAFTVVNTNYSGAGSLRLIITDANAAGGGAVGNFANGVPLSHAPANVVGG